MAFSLNPFTNNLDDKGQSGPSGPGVHNDLTGRDEPDCHPESAVTGLTGHLSGLQSSIDAIKAKRFIIREGWENRVDLLPSKSVKYALLDNIHGGGVIALGPASAEVNGGYVCAELPGPVGTESTAIVFDDAGRIANLVIILDAHHLPMYDTDDVQVYGLLQCANGTADGTHISHSNQVQVSYVKLAPTLSVISGNAYAAKAMFLRLYDYDHLPNLVEDDRFHRSFNDPASYQGATKLDDLTDCHASGTRVCVGSHAGDGATNSRLTALGYRAGYGNIGNFTVAIGDEACGGNPRIRYSTAIGPAAMRGAGSGTPTNSVAIGYHALYAIESGSYNFALGNNTLAHCTSGNRNTAVGPSSLQSLTTGNDNVALGYAVMLNLQTGSGNFAGGLVPMQYMIDGSNNFAFGYHAMQHVQHGDRNLALGYDAGHYFTGGNHVTQMSDCIFFGNSVGPEADGSQYEIVFGINLYGHGPGTMTLGGPNINVTYFTSRVNIATLPTDPAGLDPGDLYTQTADQIGGSGTTKVICIV